VSVVYFLLLVGVLVVIHEFGHFIAAKLLDFKVERFSVGFGRPLIRIRGGETEYQIALFPLGGYVRILGEDANDEIPTNEAGRSFAAKPLWQRLVVVFAGPAANLVLPIFIYFILFVGHTELPAAVVGDVLSGSPAANARIQPGDRILSLNGESVRYWEDLEQRVKSNVGNDLRFRIRRGPTEKEVFIRPLPQTVRTRDGGSKRRGFVGITQAPFPPTVGVIDQQSPAGQAGLRTGDLIISVDGNQIDNWTTLRLRLRRARRRTNIVYFRGTQVPGIPYAKLLDARTAALVPETRTDLEGKSKQYAGLEPAEMFVASVDPGSPADFAELQPGDLITKLDGESFNHWMLLDQRLQSRPDHEWLIEWRRTMPDGKVATMTARVRQVRRKDRDAYGNTFERLVFGASTDHQRGRGEYIAIDGRFTYAASKSVQRTGETIGAMVGGFWSILKGQAPSESVGGPLMMYRVASVSGQRGWETFLLMIALISVNLGLINLLPIPVLDGGHLILFAVEAVRRKPLSLKTRERVQWAGLAIVGMITVLALRNDVIRYVL